MSSSRLYTIALYSFLEATTEGSLAHVGHLTFNRRAIQSKIMHQNYLFFKLSVQNTFLFNSLKNVAKCYSVSL